MIKTMQEGFQTLIDSFYLPIRLLVIHGAEIESGVCYLEQLLPQTASKEFLLIRQIDLRHPMQLLSMKG